MVYGHGQRAGSPARTNPVPCRVKSKSCSAGGAELFQQRGAELHCTLWELKLKYAIKRKNCPPPHPAPPGPLPQLQLYKISGCFSGGDLRARREGVMKGQCGVVTRTDGQVLVEEDGWDGDTLLRNV